MRKFFLIGVLVFLTSMAHSQNVAKNCYRGFVDAGYSFGIGDYKFGRFEINTTHGYQFNPYFFLGAGLGFHFMSSYETEGMEIALDTRESKVDIPLYANVRCNLSKKKFVPFIDLKGGTFVTDNGGLYASASVGCRLSLNEKQALSVAVGYTLEGLQFETFDRFVNNVNMEYTRCTTKYTTESISIKLGFEF